VSENSQSTRTHRNKCTAHRRSISATPTRGSVAQNAGVPRITDAATWVASTPCSDPMDAKVRAPWPQIGCDNAQARRHQLGTQSISCHGQRKALQHSNSDVKIGTAQFKRQFGPVHDRISLNMGPE